MKVTNFLSAAALAASCLLPAGAWAQERTQDEDEILIEGERTPAETRRVERESRPSKRQSLGQDQAAAPSNGGSETAITDPDWELLEMMRHANSNSPLYRYGLAIAMADCVVASVGDGAAEYVVVEDDPEFTALAARMGRHQQCANSLPMGVPARLLNAALAEKMILRQVAQPDLIASDVPMPAAAIFIAGGRDEVDFATVARCLVVNAPGYAYDLLLTAPGKSSEREAFADLYAAAPECGVAGGIKGVSRVAQRLPIALALFQWNELGRMGAVR